MSYFVSNGARYGKASICLGGFIDVVRGIPSVTAFRQTIDHSNMSMRWNHCTAFGWLRLSPTLTSFKCTIAQWPLHVITQSPPRPKGPLALYVHTQETVDHTLLRVAVCSTTVEADSVCT